MGKIVLEEFDCYVHSVYDGVANIEITSRLNGDELVGEYSAEELASKGIVEGRRFLVRTVSDDGKTGIEFELIPRRKLTPEEVKAIHDEIDRAFPDTDEEVIY